MEVKAIVDDAYTDPWIIFQQYQFGPSELFATEVLGNPATAVSTSPSAPELPELPPMGPEEPPILIVP